MQVLHSPGAIASSFRSSMVMVVSIVTMTILAKFSHIKSWRADVHRSIIGRYMVKDTLIEHGRIRQS